MPFRTHVLSALALTAVLALAACDSGGGPTPPAFVGTWQATELATTWVLTSNRRQQIADQSRAGEGAITATGAVTATFRYARAFLEDGAPASFMLFTDNPFVSPRPAHFATLFVTPDHVLLYADGTQYERLTGGGALPYTYANGRLQLAPTELPVPGGSGPVTVGGTLTPVLHTLEAGVEKTVAHTVSPLNSLGWRYSFEEDGAFRMDVPGRDDIAAYTGTWEALADGGLRVHQAVEGAPPGTIDYTYEIDGGQLVLLRPYQEFCTNEESAVCFDQSAFEFGAAPGSLQRVRNTEGFVLSPAAHP